MRLSAFLALAFGLSWGWWGGMWALGLRVSDGGTASHLPGLAGPLVAALIVTAAGGGLRAFLHGLVRLPPARLWPVLLAWPAAAAVWHLGAVALGRPPEPAALVAYPGVPAGVPWGLGLAAAFMLNGWGEEGGWRGWLGPHLAARLGPFAGTLAVAGVWALWHLPLFAVHEGFAAMVGLPLVGWLAGLAAAAFVLAHLHDAAGGSILAPALWHVGYNLAVATPAAGDILPPLLTLPVLVWGLVLARRAWDGNTIPPARRSPP